MAQPQLLLGDEAIALGALHAGISGAYAYPGTPSTEIFEYVEANAEKFSVSARWSANEKVAYESALGMSFAGKRALISMKHVGLNVAADAFVNSGVTGVHGGMVICVADDPGMHSSQNEQDSRYYAKFALIPCLEPSTQQEAYEMTRFAFELSEQTKLPVLLRIVTRLAHSRADVKVGEQRPQNDLNRMARGEPNFTLLPSNARVLYKQLTQKQPDLLRRAEESPYNLFSLDGDRSRGIVVNNVAWNYLREIYDGEIPHPYLRVAQYPAPRKQLLELIEAVDEILVLEEGYPLLEEQLLGTTGIPGKAVRGKLDGTLPRTGEMTPSIIGAAVDRPLESPFAAPDTLPTRPPALCPGCPHTDAFKAMTTALTEFGQPSTFSDIGCYTLGYYPPHSAIETCVDMGASISMAIGAAHAGLHPVVSALGDSTFGHSGMTGLLTAASENLNMNVFILDNGTVAMTGTQETLTTGEDLVKLVVGLGVPAEHVRVFNPLPKHHEDNVAMIKEEIAYEGLSVLISRRACIHIKRRL